MSGRNERNHKLGSPMNLKQTILAVMRRDDLRVAVHAADLDQVDRRSVQSMREALSGSHHVKPAPLLGAMSEAQVKDVCDRKGIDRTGRKNTLIQRLLSGKRRTPTADATPDDDTEAIRYDAAYLETARRRRARLATLDRELANAARNEGVAKARIT